MSKRRKKSNNFIITIIVFIFLCVSGYFGTDYFLDTSNNIAKEASANEVQITTSASIENADEVDLNNDKLNIIFFYVGQADCTLIKLNDEVMLIDAGNNSDGKNIVSFLQEKGITQIDYLVGTHADEDHIGGIDDVIKSMKIGTFLIPTVGKNGTDYKNAVEAAEEKNIPIEHPTMGDVFEFEDANSIDTSLQNSIISNTETQSANNVALHFEIMSAMEEEGTSDNNSSLVIELTYNNTKYLFMGDAETEVENSRSWNKVNVLKVGHHGSNSSSSTKFLEQIKPQYSIIEVGKNNSYNLPSDKAIKRLGESGTQILRTDKANGDEVGSFWLTSDGNTIDIREVNINLDGNG